MIHFYPKIQSENRARNSFHKLLKISDKLYDILKATLLKK